MDFKGHIKNGGLAFASSILKQRQEYLSSVKNGTEITESIKKHRSTKTQKQLGYIFGLVVEKSIAPAIRDHGYVVQRVVGTIRVGILTKEVIEAVYFHPGFTSRQVLDRLLYPWCGLIDKEGEEVTLSKMYADEAGRFVENIKDMAAECLGTQIPEPDPEWYNNFKTRTAGKKEIEI